MDKVYNHRLHEENIYSLWENEDVFTAKANKKKPIDKPIKVPKKTVLKTLELALRKCKRCNKYAPICQTLRV